MEEMKNTKEENDDEEEEEEEEEDNEDVESDDLTVEKEVEIQRRWVPMSFTCLRLLVLLYKGTETYLICSTKRLAVEPRAGFNSEREGWPGCTGV